ncbi:YqaJ viral recombinase family protein [Microvirgula aerodenitrificans]|uniref:YqaJ viral recombinase family protein n=1 Tax=Microvirgula aerodenitrificans TaxID=57480 RepID=UPI000686A72A|nr:YqaJ viral recombinase family protein [Microvirgula aerodenitrificans]
MKIHDLIQGSDEWAAFRLNHHGASEAAAMLGLSKKTTRSELLHMKHTGTPKEFSDWVQKNILDYGHEVEAMARPLIEDILGEDFYPVTCSNEDVGGNLSASCDGLTMLYDTAFEHKQWNTELATSIAAGILPADHMPQCQQIMLVTGAERVIFTVSNGTRENLVWMEVLPSPEWFDRILAGWAQFDRDLVDYTPPEVKPEVVAEPVRDLPAVIVQISGEIAVHENFSVFEAALREFLDETLIREPQTDQDFADLDLQIKAMKKAEEALDAAESQMLAQVQSIDQAKRQKDQLHKLVRDNRLMAEKLLDSEKARRKAERIEAARGAYTAHVAGLQEGIVGLTLAYQMPDFAAAIKGLRTLTSMQDKLDTALANAKIAIDLQAADLVTKLEWVAENAAEHRALLADLQQLSAKPIDDFKLVIRTRIDARKKAEEARLEAERERIRREEADKLAREAAQEATRKKAEEDATAAVARLPADIPEDPQPVALESGELWPRKALTHPLTSPVPATSTPTLRLGQINERLSPISLTADGLAGLGFTHAATDKAAKLYHASDFSRICSALVQHIQAAQGMHDPQKEKAA